MKKSILNFKMLICSCRVKKNTNIVRAYNKSIKPVYLTVLFFGIFIYGCTKKVSDTILTKTVIRFATWEILPEQLNLTRKIIAQFERTNPDVTVKFEWGSTQDKIITEIAAGTPPDVFYWVHPTILVERNAIENLTPYVTKYKLNLNNYFSAVVNELSYNGNLYMFPLHFSSYCLAYNKTIFQQAGLPFPTENWTWDEFYHTAKTLTRDNNHDGVKDWFGSTLPNLYVLIRLNHGSLVDEYTGQSTVTSPVVKAALSFAYKLYQDVCPRPEEEQTFGGKAGVNIFLTGKIAMQFTPTYMLAAFSKITHFDWDVTLLPRPEQNRPRQNLIYSGGLCIPRTGTNKDAAFRFIQYYCGPEGQRLLAETKNCVPAEIQTARDFFAVPPPAQIKKYLSAAENAVYVVPKISYWFELEKDGLQKEWDKLILKKQNLDRMIENIDLKVRQLTAEHQRK